MREPGRYKNLKPIQKGERRGRKAGVPNKFPPLLKEAVLAAASRIGFDGMGKDGLVGYLQRLALDYPESFAALLGRVLPLQARASVGVPEKVTYRTAEEFQAALEEKWSRRSAPRTH
jgi:hypothetical protein